VDIPLTCTAAASGIGLATVEHLVASGWNVTVIDFNAVNGLKVAERLGKQTLFVEANVASYQEQAKAFAETYRKWGRVDFGEFSHKFTTYPPSIVLTVVVL